MNSKEIIVDNFNKDLIEKSGVIVDSYLFSCEEDEFNMNKKNAVDVVYFRIVYNEKDIEPITKNSFKPEMAHQIFGPNETIFGYRSISIFVYYMHNSANCYVDLNGCEIASKCVSQEPDDIMKSLSSWLPKNFSTQKDEFIKKLINEQHDKIYGTTLETFQNNQCKPKGGQKINYKINLCDLTENGFKDFHERFETFIIWFIDGANFIDLNDERWMIFYVYEEVLEQNAQEIIRSPVGFCTVYKFLSYPDLIRARISQFFILPTHQRRGIGRQFYSTVFNYLRLMPEVKDITVEEPTEIFQRIRDYCDSLLVYNNTQNLNLTGSHPKQRNRLMQQYKIGKRQSQRVFDILECINARNSNFTDTAQFAETVKTRFLSKIEKEVRGSKKRCTVVPLPDSTDIKLNADAQCKKYVESLEWPLNNLMKKLRLQ